MNTHTSAANALRTQPLTQLSLGSMLRNVFSQRPVQQGPQAGEKAVRPKKDPILKLSDKAGVLYWKWQELLEKDEADHEGERVGNKRMGRPPVPLATLRKRAQAEYDAQLVELRAAEQEAGREPISEDEIITKGEKLREKGPGRPAISEIGRKFRHLRRKLKTLEDALAAVDGAGEEKYDGIGRPAMSARERVAYYEREIDGVKRDIDKAMSEMPAAERLKTMLDNARIDRRDAGMKRRKAEHDGADQGTIDALRGLEKKLTEEVYALEMQLMDERTQQQPAQFGTKETAIERPQAHDYTYSPGMLDIIAKLESQIIVPTPPAELSHESLAKFKADVELAKEFNAAILAQIESLKSR